MLWSTELRARGGAIIPTPPAAPTDGRVAPTRPAAAHSAGASPAFPDVAPSPVHPVRVAVVGIAAASAFDAGRAGHGAAGRRPRHRVRPGRACGRHRRRAHRRRSRRPPRHAHRRRIRRGIRRVRGPAAALPRRADRAPGHRTRRRRRPRRPAHRPPDGLRLADRPPAPDAPVRPDALGLAASSTATCSTTASTSRRSAATGSWPPTTASSSRRAGSSTSLSAGSAISAPTTTASTVHHLWSELPIVVIIDDGNTYRSVYAHFEQVKVHPGQRVHAGQLIGYEGTHRPRDRLPPPLRDVLAVPDGDVPAARRHRARTCGCRRSRSPGSTRCWFCRTAAALGLGEELGRQLDPRGRLRGSTCCPRRHPCHSVPTVSTRSSHRSTLRAARISRRSTGPFAALARTSRPSSRAAWSATATAATRTPAAAPARAHRCPLRLGRTGSASTSASPRWSGGRTGCPRRTAARAASGSSAPRIWTRACSRRSSPTRAGSTASTSIGRASPSARASAPTSPRPARARPPIAPADQRPRGIGERLVERRAGTAVAPLDRQRRSLARARPRVHAREVERLAASLGLAQLLEQRLGPVGRRRVGRHLALRCHRGRRSRMARQPAATSGVTRRRPGPAWRRGARPRVQPAAWWSSAYSSRSANAPRRSAGDPSPNTASIDGANTSARSRSIARTVRCRYTWRYMKSRAVRNISSAPRPDSYSVRPALGHERVPAQALGIDRAHRHAGEVGVAADVVEVVHGEHAREQRLERPHPAGHRRVHERRLRDEERDPARVDRLGLGEPIAVGTEPGARRSAEISGAQLALDDQLREVLVAERLGAAPPRVRRCREPREEPLVEEVRERPVADVVEEPGHAQRLDDETLGRYGLAWSEDGQRRGERRVERPRPEPGLVHDPEAVREPRVLGGGEDPARALELADAPQALDPRGVEEILLGDGLHVAAPRARVVGRQAFGELDVPVDGVVIRLTAANGSRRPGAASAGVGQGNQIRFSAVHAERLPRRSADWTRNE